MFFSSIYIFIVQLANEVAEVVVYNFCWSSQLKCQDNGGRQGLDFTPLSVSERSKLVEVYSNEEVHRLSGSI